MRRSLRTARPSSRWRRRRTGRCAAPWSSRRRRGRVRRWHSGKYAARGRARESPARNRPSLVKGSSPGKDFILRTGCAIDGEATASRDGAADRPRADDDALPPGRNGGAPTPRRPRATLRRTRAADRDALQRSSAGAIQAVLLQEVSRVPPPLRQRPSPCGAGSVSREVPHLRRRPGVSVSSRTSRSTRVPPLVRRRHVDLAGLPGEVLPHLENQDAQAEEGDGRHEEEEENRRRVVSGQGRVHGEIRSEEPPREVEPVRQGDRAADRLAPTRQNREGEQDPAEDAEQPWNSLRKAVRVLRGQERDPAKADADGQEHRKAQDGGGEEHRNVDEGKEQSHAGRPIATKTTYISTRMKAPATGLMMEYRTKSHGSVQFESISQPSHAATLKVRQYVLIDAVRSASPLASRASLGTPGSTLRGLGRRPP